MPLGGQTSKALRDAIARGPCDNCGKTAVLRRAEICGFEVYTCEVCTENRHLRAERDALILAAISFMDSLQRAGRVEHGSVASNELHAAIRKAQGLQP